MRYRVQVTVGAGHLTAVIEAACKDNPEPGLHVEPVADQPALPPPAPKRRAQAPKDTEPTKRRAPSSPNQRGEVIERSLKTGPKRWKELRVALGEAGLSHWSLNSLINKWQKDGKIRRSADGLWNLVEHERERVSTP